MFIQTETTPNDDSLKFIPGVPVMGEGTAEFLDTRSALASPLAIRLMGVDGVTSVFYGPDFVTVSKDSELTWAVMKPEIYPLLMEYFSSGQPLFRSEEDRENAGPQDTRILDTDSETVAMIKELLETRVRPAIMDDGGDIEYRGFDESSGLVHVKLKGSCRGCSSSTVTLKSGIERMLMHYIPEVKGVEQIIDQEEEIALEEFNKLEQKLAGKAIQKDSSESCIKGHRSSSCHHNDRPLFEIKKKGRPVSQCEKCRELRQSKRVHSKCTCNEPDSVSRGESSKAALGIKAKRFIPIVPALPNGLQDVLKTSRVTSSPADVRQRGQDKGLDVLVRAAAIFENLPSTPATHTAAPLKTSKRISSRPPSPSNSNNSAPNKRTKHAKVALPSPGPDLAPIFLNTLSSSSGGPSLRLPTFETMPPMSTIKSLAGSGCTCGFQCACPGCIEHRGPEHASSARKDCADGCGTCVDYASGIALPTASNSAASSSTSNFLDRFFARAASLPAPPTNRKIGVGVALDPMNIMVYPEVALSDSDRAAAFGLVTIPKLECCGGICGCPEGTCGCGKACSGCCKDHFPGQDRPSIRTEEKEESTEPQVIPAVAADTVEPAPSMAPVRNCCVNNSILVAQ
ncbi:hypothetical protein C0995_008564 [Termitomyces sp. Mi166|nr:hypothetical protein C0995_008564 [Termitomyces sp. Mi166\